MRWCGRRLLPNQVFISGAEELDHRDRFVFVTLKPIPDDFGLVIFSLDQIATALITFSGLLGRLRVQIVKISTPGADSPPTESLDGSLQVQSQHQHRTKIELLVLQQLKEPFDLIAAPGKSVEQDEIVLNSFRLG